MELLSDTTDGAVRDREFRLLVEDRVVPIVAWSPVEAAPGTPLVAIGHGGGGHKRMRTVSGLARTLVEQYGIAAVAMDGVEHGDREGGAILDREAALARRDARKANPAVELYGQMTADWTAVIDHVLPWFGGPLGYFGLSMGTRYGLPYLGGEARARAAVFGLNGIFAPEVANPDQAMVRPLYLAAAAKITFPLLYLMQQDDELFPRANALALFDTFATTRKQLHLNVGGHFDVPAHEYAYAAAFLAEHLRAAAGTTA